jgi:hypothetical protein
LSIPEENQVRTALIHPTSKIKCSAAEQTNAANVNRSDNLVAKRKNVTSIWNKPLGKTFWTIALSVTLASLTFVILYPLLHAGLEWSAHPNMRYRGITFSLPFGWVLSYTDASLTLKKPWPSILTGMESSLFIQKGDPFNDRRDALITEWEKLHPSSSLWTEVDLFPTSSNHSTLHLYCKSQNVMSGWRIRLECLSSDGVWTFRFLGKQSDMRQAVDIIHNVIARDLPPTS